MSCDARKPVFGVRTRSDTNRPVQSQKKSRSLAIRIYEEEGLYYANSENKATDQLRSYCKADLRFCFRIGKNLVFSRRGLNYLAMSKSVKHLVQF